MSHVTLRTIGVAVALVAAAACSDSSSSSPTSPTGPTGSLAYNISIDTMTTLDSSNVPIRSTIPVRVVVTRSGSPASATTVTWRVSAGHGHVSDSTSQTDSLGRAVISWTLGDTLGLNTLTVVAGDNSLTVKAFGVAGPAALLVRVTSDSLFIVDGATALLTARVTDAFGNPVQGATIEWSASDGGLSATESKTGTSGHAEDAFTSPMSPGESTVTATLPGKGSITFRIGHL